jgi:hypothetical protein
MTFCNLNKFVQTMFQGTFGVNQVRTEPAVVHPAASAATLGPAMPPTLC